MQVKPRTALSPKLAQPQTSAFVGRQRHLAALSEAFLASKRGRTVAVYVRGRSGLGKSALVQRFLDGLVESDDAVVLAGRCYEREDVPYKALDSVIDELARWLKRLAPLEAEGLMPRDAAASIWSARSSTFSRETSPSVRPYANTRSGSAA